MKECPYCCEEIEAAAVVCVHCDAALVPSTGETPGGAQPPDTGVRPPPTRPRGGLIRGNEARGGRSSTAPPPLTRGATTRG